MDESMSPPRLGGSIGYNRIHNLEIEANNGGESELLSEFRQFCLDFQEHLETTCQAIDWDRLFMTAFITISLGLIMLAFFPYVQNGLITDQYLQHQISLNSLTISEFQVSSALVTGKCDISLNFTNLGDRSIYHETSILSIFMEHELLWVTRTGDFFLDIGNNIMFDVSINKTTISVPASFVPTALVESQKLHKPLSFKLKYDGLIREGVAAWYEERSHIYVVCGWIEMKFLDDSTLKGGPANCTLESY